MKPLQVKSRQRLVPALLAFFAAFTTLTKIFILTMLTQMRGMDWTYLAFALPRIAGIASVVGVLAWFLAGVLQRHLLALLFGAIIGLVGGAAFVAAA